MSSVHSPGSGRSDVPSRGSSIEKRTEYFNLPGKVGSSRHANFMRVLDLIGVKQKAKEQDPTKPETAAKPGDTAKAPADAAKPAEKPKAEDAAKHGDTKAEAKPADKPAEKAKH